MSAARPYKPSDPPVATTSEECGLEGTPVGIQNAGSAAAISGGASSRSTPSSSLATEASPVSSGGGGDDTFLILDRSFARPTPFLPARLASHVGEGAVGMATNSKAVGAIPGEDLLSFPAELPGVSFLPEAAAGEPFRLCFPTDVAFLPPPRGDVFSADPRVFFEVLFAVEGVGETGGAETFFGARVCDRTDSHLVNDGSRALSAALASLAPFLFHTLFDAPPSANICVPNPNIRSPFVHAAA